MKTTPSVRTTSGKVTASFFKNSVDVTLRPLQLPEIPVASGTNPITAAEKGLEAKLLPPSGDGENDSDVELMDGPRGGGAEGEEVVKL